MLAEGSRRDRKKVVPYNAQPSTKKPKPKKPKPKKPKPKMESIVPAGVHPGLFVDAKDRKEFTHADTKQCDRVLGTKKEICNQHANVWRRTCILCQMPLCTQIYNKWIGFLKPRDETMEHFEGGKIDCDHMLPASYIYYLLSQQEKLCPKGVCEINETKASGLFVAKKTPTGTNVYFYHRNFDFITWVHDNCNGLKSNILFIKLINSDAGDRDITKEDWESIKGKSRPPSNWKFKSHLLNISIYLHALWTGLTLKTVTETAIQLEGENLGVELAKLKSHSSEMRKGFSKQLREIWAPNKFRYLLRELAAGRRGELTEKKQIISADTAAKEGWKAVVSPEKGGVFVYKNTKTEEEHLPYGDAPSEAFNLAVKRWWFQSQTKILSLVADKLAHYLNETTGGKDDWRNFLPEVSEPQKKTKKDVVRWFQKFNPTGSFGGFSAAQAMATMNVD